MSEGFTRREVLRAGLASSIVAAFSRFAPAQTQPSQLGQLPHGPGRVVAESGEAKQVQLIRTWRGRLCRARLINHGPRPVAIKEVILFDIPVTLPPETKLYGEGFQMLTQTGGTLGEPVSYSHVHGR